MGWDVAGGTRMTDGTEETSTRPRGSSTALTPEEICDRVFGEYTKDGPSIRVDIKVDSSLRKPWNYWVEGSPPDWYPTFGQYG